ncbi:MAG: sigma-54-dependent Fis family transcriptional regulator [Betaproteobacteria bacterium]|nr:sigma-54-dependent Fis family transcriptional regulator [Betaproteobacteria bacterium]
MSSKPALLIVDDDPLIGESLSFVLADDFEILACQSRVEAMEKLRDGKFRPAIALIDLGLPPMPDLPTEGFRLVGDLLSWSPAIRILVLSGQNEDSNARRARALGAADLVPKPCDPARLKKLLHAALRLQQEGATADAEEAAHGLIGDSQAMRKLKSQIDLYASSAFPALIEGESGSGKERVAAALHYLSPRSKLPFLALNCAAISTNLVEPTLFGYAKGAFTGAAGNKAGYFEDASEGTLFLDEIGELPLDLQPKLLRVLENGEFQRVGETQTRHSRARIIAATNRDLRAEVRAGRFRADLYHRLSVFSLLVPPLRDLGEDKLKLLEYYRNLYAEKHGTKPFVLDDAAREAWLEYVFPGNVRELKNIVIRLTAKHSGYTIGKEELFAEFELSAPPSQQLEAAAGSVPSSIASEIEASTGFSLATALAAVELQYIDAAVELARGNMSQAARLLGISRSTLYSRLDALRPGQTKDRE